ncbi:hypothetical protein [Acetivibrio cellulolyticus]|uniref:hypothetical protein n=1 Tax=Acetivibrio cellulolyticus TaxID=35830 RepID=UPI0001E2C30B|nr:hypothetical protein [Acetivibrio cellulolyticus]
MQTLGDRPCKGAGRPWRGFTRVRLRKLFFVLGTIAIIVAVGFLLLIKGIKMIFGKGELGKRELGRAFLVILLGILVSGGSWIGVIDLGNKVIVEPVNNTIIEEGQQGNQQGNGNSQNNSQKN